MSELIGQIFPETYDGKRIVMRTPWAQPGEQIVPAGSPPNFAFQGNPYQSATDLPFEVHAIKPRASVSLAASPFIPVAEPAPGINKFWRLLVKSLTISEDLMQGACLVDTLVDDDTGFWNFGYPTYVKAGTGFTVKVDSLVPAPLVLRAEVTFHGYLILTEDNPAWIKSRGG